MASTSLLPPVLQGEQRPRVCNVPPAVSSAGKEAVALAARAGLVLDPWQVFDLEQMLLERPDGRWACFEFGLLVARQNGKGAVLEARALAGLFLFGEQLIVWSAHEFKTAKEAYLRVKALIENTPELLARVKRRGTRVIGFRQSNEDTSIELESGQRLRFMARNKSAGRGFTGDVNILDEAQELPTTAIDAMMPTLLAKTQHGNPQLIYTGTVPGPTNDSEHWTRVRDRGRAGDDPKLGWVEHTPDPGPGRELTDVDLDDPRMVAQANPALGFRISMEGISSLRASMSAEGFAREVMSIWGAGSTRSVIDMDVWAELVDAGSSALDPVGMAIDVTPDRSAASIGCAGRRADGLWHLEVVASDSGTGWLVAAAVELDARFEPRWIIDARSPAASLIADLAEAGVAVHTGSTNDLGKACGMFADAVEERTARHLGQALLSSALGVATKRKLGTSDLWAWQRSDGLTDISPLVAVTLAMRAHQLSPAAEKKSKQPGRFRSY